MNSRFGAGARGPPPTREETAPIASDGSSPASLQELLQEKIGDRPQECQVEVRHFTATNWGRRHENEDRFMNQQHALNESFRFHTVGVLDGHDSETASDFASRLLPNEVTKLFGEGKPVNEAYKLAMEILEDRLKSVTASAGTCVLSCTIAGRFIWCANLGDCRSILVPLGLPDAPAVAHTASSTLPSAPRSHLPKAKVNGIVWMSRDLKASVPWEQERIRNVGGHVVDGRVEGLEPSRTLGDFDVKASVAPGVISIVPEMRRYELGNGTSTAQAVMICATDGVWDVMTGQDICNLIAARKEIVKLQSDMAASSEMARHSADVLRDLAEDLVQFSIAKGSRDDCTAIVSFISVPPCRDGEQTTTTSL